jgi:hypothetical protein
LRCAADNQKAEDIMAVSAGFIGPGNMGNPMVSTILKNGLTRRIRHPQALVLPGKLPHAALVTDS